MSRIRDLQGLGPKTELILNEIGIHTAEQLKEIGAIPAFIRLREQASRRPSLNFLYALVGAIEGEHWLTIAKQEKTRLLMALEGYETLEAMFEQEKNNT